MIYLRADTNTEVLIGPAVAVGDGFTPVTTLSTSGADEAELIKYGGSTPLTTTSISASAMTAITGADGYYTLDLSTGNTDTEGFLVVAFNDDSLILPIRHEFHVLNANTYDALFDAAGTDTLQVDLTQIVGGTVPTPTTTGVPDVNVERWLDTLVTLGAGAPDVNVASMDAGSIASGVIAAAELTNIENEIWDALKSAHVVANSFGDFLDIEVSSKADAGSAMTLTAAAVDLIWDETMAGHVTADTAGLVMNEWQDAGRLDAILDNVLADTDDIQTRLPAALIGGRMDSDVEAINNDTTAASNLRQSTLQVITGQAEATPSTTVIQTDLAETQDDIYIGRIIIFTSGAAKDEATDITDYTGSTGTVQVTALANAPAATDTFIII
ncbi:MAG: hypothetical protein ACXABY_23230 [Candidatus Thorarchaeota archaeon]|jgi:hypothetical protein